MAGEAAKKLPGARGRTESESQEAQLALLLKFALEDESLDRQTKTGIQRMLRSRRIRGRELSSLVVPLRSLSKRLNLHPLVLALMAHDYLRENDLGKGGLAGLDDWFHLSDETRTQRRLVLCKAREALIDSIFSVERLNEDTEACIKLALSKVGDARKALDVLMLKVGAERGRRAKLFSHYSRRDLQAFYLRRMRGLPASDRRILALFADELTDLSDIGEQKRLVGRSSDRISEVAKRLTSILRPLGYDSCEHPDDLGWMLLDWHPTTLRQLGLIKDLPKKHLRRGSKNLANPEKLDHVQPPGSPLELDDESD